MKPMAIQPDQISDGHIGMLITRDHAIVGTRFRKGHEITSGDLATLRQADRPIHVVEMVAGDVSESVAVPRIATAIRSDHTSQTSIQQGRVNIHSTVRGLLCIDTGPLLRLNTYPEIGVFTHYDGMAVNEGALVAGVKIAPVAMDGTQLDAAIAAISSPIVAVKPFRPLTVTCIVAEDLQGRIRDRFEQTLQQKMDWYGADLQPIVWVDESESRIESAIQRAIPESDLVFTAGSHMMDPLDSILLALDQIKAPLVRLGAPAHPGSMVWIANHTASNTPILSLASCSMFSQSTVADLLMPYIFAGVDVTNELIANLGHGGLLDRGMDWRFPPYEVAE